jgi:hypothetical protein
MLQNRPNSIEEAKVQNKSREDWGGLLRAAASSNMSFDTNPYQQEAVST